MHHDRRLPTAFGLAALATACVLYGAGYAWARLTNALVFNGHYVVGARASRGPAGFTTAERLFLPLAEAEGVVRSTLGLTGALTRPAPAPMPPPPLSPPGPGP